MTLRTRHFPHKKTPFFTLFILSRTSDNTISQNIGGTNAWAVPHLKLWGDRPPSPPYVSAPGCSAIFSRVEHWKSALSFDMTASNTRLCNCRHHTIEPIVGAAFKKKSVRTSTGPEILLFERFKHKWQFVDRDNFMAARKAVKHGMQWKLWWTNFIFKSWNFPRKIFELEEPREL